jgi:hypothetical protein
MNPYVFDPKKIQTVEQANSVLKFFNAEFIAETEVINQAEELLGATIDVLIQKYPDAADSLNQLAYSGKLVGHAEQARQDTELMRQQFLSALPYAIKQQLPH